MKNLISKLTLFCLGVMFFSINCLQAAPVSASAAARMTVPAAEKADWQAEWAKTLAKAKLEGKVSVANTVGPEVRQSLKAAFKKKYGIEIEDFGATTSEVVAKVNAERNAGLYLKDIVMAGASALPPLAKAAEPMQEAFILPEVKDVNVWLDRKLPYYDDERKIFMYLARVGPTLLINKEKVKPEEIKSWLDLLDPKWKGKILLFDPSMPGAGNALMATIGEIMGVNYLQDLAKQEPVINRDKRLQVEWVGRGKYMVGIAFDFSNMEDLRRAGVPLMHVVPVEGTYFGSGHGGISIFSRPAHPNAAKVFLNWFLSKEGQTFYTKIAREQSRRVDIASELAPDRLIQAGIKYIDGDAKHMLAKRKEMLSLSKKIFDLQRK